MAQLRHLQIGILHNTYIKKGGEDLVAQAEYDLLKSNGYHVHFLKFSNPAGRIKQFLYFLISPFNIFSFFKCCRWLKRNNIGLLHVHNWFFAASPSVFWAAKYCKVPVIMTMHNYRMICPSATLIFNGRPYLKSLNSSFSRDAVKDGVYRNSSVLTIILAFTIWLNSKAGTWKLIKTIIVLTKHSQVVIENSHLSGLTPKLKIKPNFLLPVTVNKLIARQQNFLFVGRLSDEKGIKILLEAFKNSPHQLTIIGEGPLQQEVEDMARDNTNITYLGFKNRDFINNELQRCSALVFPSIWYETFGLILIEAFALSTPVIASYCGSASIIVKHGYNGLHFEKSNLTNLKEKIEEWASFNDAVKQQYRKNALESYLQYYTPEKNLEQLIDIYQAAVN